MLPPAAPPPPAIRPRATWTGLRSLSVRSAIAAVCLIALTATSLLPPALHAIAGMSWSRLSEIGQAYGTLAAALTALTLGMLAVSIFLQARDARIAQEHGTRTLHLELVQMAIDDPRLGLWSLSSKTETRRQRYFNLWLMLWKTMYRLGDMTEGDLRLTLRRDLFPARSDAFGQRMWQRSREAYLTNVRGRREQRFFDIVDDEYRRSVETILRRPPDRLITGRVIDATRRTLSHALHRTRTHSRQYS